MFLYKAIVFLPLIGAIVAGLFGRAIGAKASEYVTSGLMIIAGILSWIVFFNVGMGHLEGGPIKVEVLRWISWDLCEWMQPTGAFYFEHYIKGLFGMGEPDRAALAD